MLSPEKSRCVHFCRKRSLHPDPVIQIRGVDIPVVEEVRFLGVIFDRKLTFLSHVLHLRMRCEKSLNILKVLSTTKWGADRTSLLRIYQSVILSRIDYGCEIYGTARSGVLRNLDTVHNGALRICSGAFRTSPIHSLNVICHQLPLYLRWKKLSELYFFHIESSINHPLRRINLPIGLGRLYNARPSNILPFRERVKRAFADVNILNLQIHNTTALALPPWDVPEISYLNPFLTYDKSTTSSIVFQQLFLYHRNEYSTHIPVFTDGSKTAYHVGCAVVIAEDTSSFQLSTLCSVLTAELMAIMIALEKISNLSDHKFCIYSDSMSALEALSHPHTKTHPLAIDILHLWRNLQTRNYQILFCWLPGHAGLFGNESADAAAKAASTSLQRPDITLWLVVPVRELDVKLTRLRIGHTRLAHKHLLFGERCPTITCKPHIQKDKSPQGILLTYYRCGCSPTIEPKCANCAQPHESSSKYCPTWKHEKEIEKLKAQKNISYAEAQKAVSGTLGEVSAIRKLRSGDLLVEVNSRKQSHQILKLKALATIPISIVAEKVPPAKTSESDTEPFTNSAPESHDPPKRKLKRKPPRALK
ncbi:uncharacterized protein LOC129956637 [Argiope bruennichi]|uniref:uncharacterized protein LOC129956636 n=1 Tax=Argiope bruennichi TaxID=94029 RepID=UPI0024956A5C|nr:uncharacterized protein LOC129956636 [Argiope bruennichi]XP_055924546.1 uncharacterized protein LOC129956637 [Argiope bruennichi]